MGRYSTGAQTVNAIQRLEVSDLNRYGYFDFIKAKRYGHHAQTMKWNNGGSIGIETHNTKEGCFLVLDYTVTDQSTGERTSIKYKVQIELIPSNLGKGYLLYFICPVSFRRCRILYRAYGSLHFKAREAYNYRLYYEIQTSSKKYLIINKKIAAEKRLEKMVIAKKRNQTTFKGKPTKYSLKMNKLSLQVERLESDSFKLLVSMFKMKT